MYTTGMLQLKIGNRILSGEEQGSRGAAGSAEFLKSGGVVLCFFFCFGFGFLRGFLVFGFLGFFGFLVCCCILYSTSLSSYVQPNDGHHYGRNM